MLEHVFSETYTKFKLQFYRKIFSRFETREATLSAVETFCVEVINALGEPTINEFAQFVNISQANAAYKVQSLLESGYVEKIRSETDKREYHLRVTEKYHQFNRVNIDYVNEVVRLMRERFDEKELAHFESMLKIICDDLMKDL